MNERPEKILESLLRYGGENEWIEYKLNFHSNEELGETISALSNSSLLHGQPFGYLVFGIEDVTLQIKGTTFKPSRHKAKGNEDIEHWISQRLRPGIHYTIYEFEYQEKNLVLFQITAANSFPVSFSKKTYIRVGTIVRGLIDFPDKEKELWKLLGGADFESGVSIDGLKEAEILKLLDTKSFFNLMNFPYPNSAEIIINKFKTEKLILAREGYYSITNLGAILFAHDLSDFPSVRTKYARVLVYSGKDKLNAQVDQIGKKGYAVGFQGLINFITNQLPTNEIIKEALRTKVKMYPDLAVRELVANCLILQDFFEKGNPMIEIFLDRIEISNPGAPVIKVEHFIDEYQSRNEGLADLTRRLGICEARGSGIDKVVHSCELYQLPAPNFLIQPKFTKCIIYAHQNLNNMDKQDKIRACYQHSVMKYISNSKMTNQTLRTRFNIADQNSAIASRIIKDTVESGLIKEEDPSNTSRKFSSYVPFWA